MTPAAQSLPVRLSRLTGTPWFDLLEPDERRSLRRHLHPLHRLEDRRLRLPCTSGDHLRMHLWHSKHLLTCSLRDPTRHFGAMHRLPAGLSKWDTWNRSLNFAP